MAQRRSRSPARRRPARRRGRRGARTWLTWPLIVAAFALAAVTLGWLDSWSPRAPRPATARMSAEAARASNQAFPLHAERRRTASRYRFRGGEAERAQAVECLATAALYEAGDDRRGQRAVMQVVLNRVRAPGYPKTVCGVVYQGATRDTGCQFSFTCDGSVGRRPVRTGWIGARRMARRALAGEVDAEVGRATHYHTDWMVPYWRNSLVKVARVGTHLFYVRA
ncbi:MULTISPECIES: cell wall hydrolase [unclassified Sphingomonas]|uniref:cell wall hydrolase n=1 Tax=unclassified Sphingomonas TaxID=196159 RepID=UPI001619D5B9|nr:MULTISPECIES: cell wall hydrolase [unclassified Sphingomonas]MBB3347381.1 spore germination cell wall hydrolase CwlJ-like protein [Sphingomonas sp. BK069]MBB3472176.1 spore germination cell wall hydrolase CwlJ-like protein [Sphingomonas sp. BK345]